MIDVKLNELMAETRVNSQIWNNVSERARAGDIQLQKVQTSLARLMVAVVLVVDGLVAG